MNDMVSLYKEWPLEIQMSRLQIRLRVKQMTSRFLIFSSDIYDVLIQIESSEVVRIMRIHCRVVPVFSPFFFFLYSNIMHLFLCQRVFISSSFGIASRSVYDVIHGANPDFWISLSLWMISVVVFLTPSKMRTSPKRIVSRRRVITP